MKHVDTVLFVDDEPRILEGLKSRLHKEPYTILLATSGEEGLETLENHPVDLVVSDEQMPGMCGSEFLTAVCREYPETIRITLTGQASLKAAIRAINDGEIYRFLTKPCNTVDLAHTIRQALQLKKLTRENARLLAAARQQQAILLALERDHPEITKVDLTEGGEVLLNETSEDLESLINEINMKI